MESPRARRLSKSVKTVAGSVAAVADAVEAVVSASATARLYADELVKLGKMVKRLHPVLEDLKDNKPAEKSVEEGGVAALEVRCGAARARPAPAPAPVSVAYVATGHKTTLSAV